MLKKSHYRKLVLGMLTVGLVTSVAPSNEVIAAYTPERQTTQPLSKISTPSIPMINKGLPNIPSLANLPNPKDVPANIRKRVATQLNRLQGIDPTDNGIAAASYGGRSDEPAHLIGDTIKDPYLRSTLLATYNSLADTPLTDASDIPYGELIKLMRAKEKTIDVIDLGLDGSNLFNKTPLVERKPSVLVTPEGTNMIDASKVTNWGGILNLSNMYFSIKFHSKAEVVLYDKTATNDFEKEHYRVGADTTILTLDYESDGTEPMTTLNQQKGDIVIDYLKNKDTLTLMPFAARDIDLIIKTDTKKLSFKQSSGIGGLDLLAPNIDTDFEISPRTLGSSVATVVIKSDTIHAKFVGIDGISILNFETDNPVDPDIVRNMISIWVFEFKVTKKHGIGKVDLPYLPTTPKNYLIRVYLNNISTASYNAFNVEDHPRMTDFTITGSNITEPKNFDNRPTLIRVGYFDTQVEYGVIAGPDWQQSNSVIYAVTLVLNTVRKGKTDSWYTDPTSSDLIIPLTSITRGLSTDNTVANVALPKVADDGQGTTASFTSGTDLLKAGDYQVDLANGVIRVPQAALTRAVNNNLKPDMRFNYRLTDKSTVGAHDALSPDYAHPEMSGHTDFDNVDLAKYIVEPAGNLDFKEPSHEFGTHDNVPGIYRLAFPELKIGKGYNLANTELRLTATPFSKPKDKDGAAATLKGNLTLNKGTLNMAAPDYKGSFELDNTSTVTVPTDPNSEGVLLAYLNKDITKEEVVKDTAGSQSLQFNLEKRPAAGTYTTVITATIQPRLIP